VVFDLKCGFDALNLDVSFAVNLKYLINSSVAPGVGLEHNPHTLGVMVFSNTSYTIVLGLYHLINKFLADT
jgi:hypothetical protein